MTDNQADEIWFAFKIVLHWNTRQGAAMLPPPNMKTNTSLANNSLASGAGYAVFILTMMNLLNYLDRIIPSVVKDLFKADLKLTDAQTSLPITGFVIVYMLTSPIFGALADRWSRKVLIALGVALWSLATGAAALAVGFWTFLLARAFVGIGEAAYATISPALLSDFYPPEKRNRIITIFYVAIPVGSALGFILGGFFGDSFGWRAAFLICGLPGLALAGLALTIRDPDRGRYDADASAMPPPWSQALRPLLKNREYVLAVAGYAAVTFASGALADWFPTFLQRQHAMSVKASGMYVGASAALGGLLGTALGGVFGDALKRWTRQPYLALSGGSMALTTIFAFLALRVSNTTVTIIMLFIAQFFLWFYNGPINALIANSVPSALRVRAFALSILSIHIFGDAISPSIVATASDHIGLPHAIQMVPLALGVGALIWLFAWRKLPNQARSNP
jgi:MFS transporter, Spinster family, sphingosine-1-phosphate transporter